MSSSQKAQSILQPIFDQYWKAFGEGHIDKAIVFYHPDAVLIETGKSGIYGKDAIKQEKLRFSEQTGSAPMKCFNEKYQMSDDYIIYNADSEINTERSGQMKGKFCQIWKKTGDNYRILREEYSGASPGAESIVRPLLEQHRKDYNEGNFDKLTEYYHPDAILIVAGKKGTYGKEAIKQEKIAYSNRTGKANNDSLKVFNECYQMSDDYIIYSGDSEYDTEKAGKLRAKFSKIWKKTNGKYLLLRELWDLEDS